MAADQGLFEGLNVLKDNLYVGRACGKQRIHWPKYTLSLLHAGQDCIGRPLLIRAIRSADGDISSLLAPLGQVKIFFLFFFFFGT